jgi:hypothetical protein
MEVELLTISDIVGVTTRNNQKQRLSSWAHVITARRWDTKRQTAGQRAALRRKSLVRRIPRKDILRRIKNDTMKMSHQVTLMHIYLSYL